MGIHFRERGRCVPVWLTIEPATRARIEAAIENLVALLDQIDGDCDYEETGDGEPYLSWPGDGPHRERGERDPSGEGEYPHGWTVHGSERQDSRLHFWSFDELHAPALEHDPADHEDDGTAPATRHDQRQWAHGHQEGSR
ncbi:hypothetical protein [Stappia indica]|uniref:hypothetical protein n=1 Tax=Stappia indica TaxID=538381 RepID=UPI001CD1CAC1|nr:hypothetical protein [Stappia indica]MCA1298502.1 hypothetical protein [Stappia indica]